MRIFGILLDNLDHQAVIGHLHDFLNNPVFHRIATVNPEFLLLAEKDATFHEALRSADLRIIDGFGIVLAGFFRGQSINRFPGADLMEEILSIANNKKLSVYLAVRKDGLSTYEEVRSGVAKKYPDIIIDGSDINHENIGKCAIVLCNFGIPSQEIFLSSLKTKRNAVRLCMGVGGSFDYLTGKLRRAPGWMRMIGLEWLWRLVLQPRRFRRIWNAVIIFPFRLIFGTIVK